MGKQFARILPVICSLHHGSLLYHMRLSEEWTMLGQEDGLCNFMWESGTSPFWQKRRWNAGSDNIREQLKPNSPFLKDLIEPPRFLRLNFYLRK